MSQFNKYIKIAQEMISEQKTNQEEEETNQEEEEETNQETTTITTIQNVKDFIETNKQNLYFSPLKAKYKSEMIYISNKELNDNFVNRDLKVKNVIKKLKENIKDVSKGASKNIKDVSENENSNYSGGNEFIITLNKEIELGLNVAVEKFILVVPIKRVQ
jgi:hypothetical protein